MARSWSRVMCRRPDQFGHRRRLGLAGPLAVARLTITGDRIVAIDLILDPARLRAYIVED